MKKVIVLLTLFFAVTADRVAAQFVVDDGMLDTLFNARVKSLDEFIDRFNGEKILSDISVNDPLKREKNLLALFERDSLTAHQGKFGDKNELFSAIMDFIKDVVQNNRKLNLETDSMIFAIADMKMKYAAKERNIKIVLKFEHIGNGIYGWKIAGVSGLIESGIIDTSTVRIFRPVDNEMNFSTIAPTINAQNNQITQYRGFTANIDQLSYFLALCATNKISAIQCNKVIYHVLSIDGYAFVISKFDRMDKNNGWLISSFQRLDSKNRIDYLHKLLGKK
ncbi:MAG: hypothetical protein J5826_10150 [Bacteroidales bacterium]|nr:hypothetical protein [Bacteroidales bacterium]